MTTNSMSIGALEQIGISIKDMEGNAKTASQIITELASKWGSLSDAERHNTSVKVAGINQLSRFNALMLNYQMAQDATASSMDSANSAMREQEKYGQSLEARINRLDTAWASFAATAGDKVLYDGIVVLTEILRLMTDGANGLVGQIGMLAPIFGVAGVAAYAFSGSLRGLIASKYADAVASVTASGATGAMATTMTLATTATKVLRVALIGLVAATGVGVVLAGLGFVIEKLTKVISDNIQANEQFDTYVKKNTEALTENKATVEELIGQYNSLTKAKESGNWDSTQEQEYLKVQQQLGEIFPAIIDHVDSTGQSHLKNKEAIQKEIEATQELVKAQNAVTVSKAIDEFDKLNKKVNGAWYDSLTNFIYGSLESRIKQQKTIIASMQSQGLDTSEQQLELLNLERQVQDISEQIKGHIFEVAKAFSDVEIDENLSKNLENFISTLDFSKFDSVELEEFTLDFAKIQEQIQTAINTNDEELYKDAINNLNKLASTTGDADFKKFEADFKGMSEAVKNGTVIFVDGEGAMDDMGDSLGEVAQKTYDLKDAAEQLLGISQEQIDDTTSLLYQYEMLTMQMQGYTEAEIENMIAKGNLTAEEKVLVAVMEDRAKVMNKLDSIYPSLLDKDGKAVKLTEEKINAIREEKRANEVLLKAYKLSRDGKLTAEQDMTLATADRTKKRIKEIEKEITALILLQEQMYNTAMTNKEFLKGIEDGTVKSTGHSMAVPESVFEQEISKKSVSLQELKSLLGSSIDSIDKFSSAIEESSKSSSKSNKETEKSIYLTDKYKQKMDALNLAIQEQISLRNSLPEHDTRYIKSLEKQLKLENEKLATMKSQEASINAQIKSGKIQQTGMVKQSEAIKTSTKALSGWNGKITSTFGSRADKHRGIDIASPMGTRLDANVSGRVTAAGNAVKNGYDKSYGNIVVIQDSSGIKHLYAHLEKVTAKIGDAVTAGVQIGNIGSTGRSTGSHLHYEKSLNGKLLDPTQSATNARNSKVTVTTGGGSSDSANISQSIDQAKSDLVGLQQDILSQEEAINELQKSLVDSVLSGFEHKKSNYDKFLENGENRLAKLNSTSKEYRAELNKQAEALVQKKAINQAEIAQLKKIIDSGTLTEKVMAEYTNTLHELGKVNSEIDLSLKNIDAEKLESYVGLVDELIGKYAKLRNGTDGALTYENVAINDLDVSSQKYIKSLERINVLMKEKQSINRQEASGLEKLISNGELYGEALENAKNRVQELNTEIKQLQLDIQEGNFNILINIKTKSDEAIDDMQFEIDRAEALRKMYKEGSADHKKYTQDIISQYEQMADKHLATRKDLEAELKLQDITAARKKEILELLEDEHLAWLNATYAVKDYNKQLEESNKTQLEKIATDVISALKDYYQERKDEHMKLIDEELKREEKAHNERVKKLNDEMDLFRKNTEERLQLIDRQEAERGYNMEIEEMESEREKVQREINLLSMDDSYEAKSKRKKLQEQLDKIDKDIAEKRHQRDIELQKQGLGDLLENKENEIEGKLELEDEAYQAIVDRINREKEYWEKHYTDLLNDERKFAQIREDILAGHFDKVMAEFGTYIQNMKDTMPALEDTLNGTMQAVGTSIRQNVIDNLQKAIDKIHEFNATQIEDKNGFTDGGWTPPSTEDSNGNKPPEFSKGNLSSGDMKVLLGKFLTDNVAMSLSGSAKENAHKAGNVFGSAGRQEGSTIDKNTSFDAAIRGLTSAEMEELRKYFQSNMNTSGGAYSEFIKNFLGMSSGNSNTSGTGKYGLSSTLTYADMQVLTAKYMNENLLSKTTDNALRASVKQTADRLAATGRASGSKLGSNIGFDAITALMSDFQTNQLKGFMGGQVGIVGNASLQEIMRKYVASMDTGGMLNFKGKGMDNKGGKLILAHDGEVVNNPLETSQLLKTAELSNLLLSKMTSFVTPLLQSMPKIPSLPSSSITTGDEIIINFNGNISNTTEASAKNFAKTIINDIKTRKG